MAEPVRILTQRWDVEDSHTLDGYLRTGGHAGLRTALDTDPAKLRQLVKDSSLRGRGGAGFPTGMKWGFVPVDGGRPVYLVCNADESEPGTFKDRELMERDPHQLLEGMLIAGYALKSNRGFIFMRGEYLWPGIRMEEAIAEAYREGYLGKDVLGSGFAFDITLHYSAGGYIAGEETALLDALEGRRAQPRLRPPFPAVAGLYACPTVVNNAETICCVPHIVEHGAEWFKAIGTEKSAGPKLFSVSGEVARPGNYEWPMGATAREIVEVSCGGMLPGRRLKFWTPGGSSTPLLTDDHFDVPMDFESIKEAGSMLGTAAMMMFSDKTSVVEAVLNWTRFYEHESCGKCTPCREGFFWLAQVLERILHGRGRMGDITVLESAAEQIVGRSLCALGDGGAMPIQSAVRYFRDEFEYLVEHGVLPEHIEPHAGAVTDNSGVHRPGGYYPETTRPTGVTR